ncbi:MAG TPA: SRPBCC family protein [Hyphomonadaceae bacterium]|nr:SRPBCC family protein [Hyphomonadaceae bacterium]
MPNTVKLHRVFAAKPEKVYKAFVDPDAKMRWLPPYGFVGKVHHYEAKVGVGYKMSFTNFSTGNSHGWTGKYLELSSERIRYTDTFDDPNMPGAMEVTVTLKKVLVGTEVHIEQANVPAAIPLEACYLGWQQSLEQLGKLVEPEIPD